MTPTILLPIPVSWIESITFDRDGARVWVGGGDPEELDVSHELAEEIRAALMRRE
ncbi:MAG: hypothetical protein WC277_11305 [Bacilli bacterium]